MTESATPEYCEWCEELATMKRGRLDICADCDDKIDAREAGESDRNMSMAERKGWMRARNAGVN